MAKAKFYDFSDFTDPTSALQLFENAIQGALDFDALSKDGLFLAKVVSPPMWLNPKQAAALFTTPGNELNSGPSKQMNVYMFKGRIDQLHGNFLRDPCDIAFSSQPKKVNLLRRKHTDFVATTTVAGMPIEGDIVKVQLKKGAWNWDLAYGRYLGMYEVQGAPSSTDPDSPCHSALSDFIKGLRDADGLFSPKKATYLPDKRTIENGKLPSDLLVPIDARYSNPGYLMFDVVDDFDKMAKAYKLKFTTKFPFGQGYRNYEGQLKVFNDPSKVNKEGKKLAAVPGTSNHGWALAFDMSPPPDYESDTYKWMSDFSPSFNFKNPSWAIKGGSKEEPWHFESTKVSQLIKA